MSKGFRTCRAWLSATGIALILLSTSALSAQSELMLSYELTHDMLPTPDNFSVTVYADGLALVHYPEYMKQSGDYTVELSPSEVQQIRLMLEHPLIQGFNPGEAKAKKRDIDAQSNELFEISDDSWSNFEVHTSGAKKSIRWANVPVDAKRYPEIGVFRKLAEIEAELLQLNQHPTATAVVD
ncbi:MAG: hypothetical protein HKN57_08545 [Xanthomonadales bacterium]|nr:hypothetical protein [Gammaproteobacteria bacterium]MBT8053768.1 hypothetical protein [Gammaproteobacteria bacterium]NND57289.1 hypothetical protein [Xanthomonadales bacterium]NNK51605.1 hypothetical protein [Xanthomonadales bacterium]